MRRADTEDIAAEHGGESGYDGAPRIAATMTAATGWIFGAVSGWPFPTQSGTAW